MKNVAHGLFADPMLQVKPRSSERSQRQANTGVCRVLPCRVAIALAEHVFRLHRSFFPCHIAWEGLIFAADPSLGERRGSLVKRVEDVVGWEKNY